MTTARKPELRYLAMTEAEVRVDRVDGVPVLRGVAVPYGKWSVDLGGFRETFRPGAFSGALPTADIRALVNHNRDLILGRNTAGTLRLSDGPDALAYEIDPPDTSLAEHYIKAVERGDISGASFRFYCLKDEWKRDGDMLVREVIQAEIDDISIVTYPAYPDTTAALRSGEEFLRTQPRGSKLAMAERRVRLAEAE
jgi:uncharacterized protein